ncbi:hypothetical protein BDR26DRAFT_870778 [Obelidium mucronatum]|nr:hypothetical protein BDR26DRAFT_870778 [Obelidium mucronatum]
MLYTRVHWNVSWVESFSFGDKLFILAHVSATISLAFFITEAWHFQIYWYIFMFCNALPELLEIFMIWKRRIMRL